MYKYLNDHEPSLLDGPLEIDANTTKTFHEKSPSFHYDKSLLALTAHSHYVCTSWEVYMVDTLGDTTNLLYIPLWNFNYQYTYRLTKVLKIPIGAYIYGTATYDNTTNNPNNPHNPPEDVRRGQNTDDEMMNGRFWVLDYQEGDEDIILDSAFYGLPTGTIQLMGNSLSLHAYPNPSTNEFLLSAELPDHNVSWILTDATGKVVQSRTESGIHKGVYVRTIDVKNLHDGIYFLSLHSGADYAVQKIIVQH